VKKVKKAFKTEILLHDSQKQKVHQTIGVCRYVYNLYISKNKEAYEQDKNFMSGYDFSKWLNNIYTKENDTWIKDVSSKAVKKSMMNAEMAFKRFFKGLAKFPRFKKKKNQDVKAYFIKNSGKIEVERHRVKVPTLGWVKLKEFGYIPTGLTGVYCTISQKSGKYFISVLCEAVQEKHPMNTCDGIGMDVGIKELAVCSNGEKFKNINKTNKLRKIEKSLKRQQRCLSRKYENLKKEGGKAATRKNIRKQIVIVQKLHNRLTSIREEYVRYVVDTLVKAKPLYITIEDLNIKGMMKNRHLSKSIAQQKLYRLRKWLTFKCREYGIELRMVDAFYPSSKLCSQCRYKKEKLSLSERIYRCDNCGIELDRDFNASLNLKYATEYTRLT
jgi:putative transposase